MSERLSDARLWGLHNWLHRAPIPEELSAELAKALNELRERRAAGPVMPDTPSAVVIKAMLAPGADVSHWDSDTNAAIEVSNKREAELAYHRVRDALAMEQGKR